MLPREGLPPGAYGVALLMRQPTHQTPTPTPTACKLVSHLFLFKPQDLHQMFRHLTAQFPRNRIGVRIEVKALHIHDESLLAFRMPLLH